MSEILILGSGYTGSRLAHRLREQGHNVTETARSRPDQLRFDMGLRETWKNIPKVDETYWLFPAKPPDLVKEFLDLERACLGRILVLGTTSAYQNRIADELITEDSLLEESDLRVSGERLIQNEGGICMRAAGIYGPSRNPLRWLRDGRIQNFSKFVNLIHVDDLVSLLIRAMEVGDSRENYLAADGTPYRWADLARIWGERLNEKFQAPTGGESLTYSKRINPSRTLKEFGLTLKHPRVVEEVYKL